jgi:hypothetical protein
MAIVNELSSNPVRLFAGTSKQHTKLTEFGDPTRYLRNSWAQERSIEEERSVLRLDSAWTRSICCCGKLANVLTLASRCVGGQQGAADCRGKVRRASKHTHDLLRVKKAGTRNRTFRTDHSARAFATPRAPPRSTTILNLFWRSKSSSLASAPGPPREVVLLRLIATQLAPALHLQLLQPSLPCCYRPWLNDVISVRTLHQRPRSTAAPDPPVRPRRRSRRSRRSTTRTPKSTRSPSLNRTSASPPPSSVSLGVSSPVETSLSITCSGQLKNFSLLSLIGLAYCIL